MTGLCLHAGGVPATIDDLRAAELPERTETYTPVSHADMVLNVAKVAKDLIEPKGFTFLKEQFGLANRGARMFGVINYQGKSDGLSLAIGMRNSYDKTMSAGLVVGASVFVCDNLCFSGSITVMRRHTGNAEGDIFDGLLSAMYKATATYESTVALAQALRAREIKRVEEGYQMIGILVGRQVLAARQHPVAFDEWREPTHEEFKPRNAWSLYNAVTAALKGTPVNELFEKHLAVTETFRKEYKLQEVAS